MEIDYLRTWVGREEYRTEVLSDRIIQQFNATFDLTGEYEDGADAPPMIHLCLAQPTVPTRLLGRDGHAELGLFLPPIPLSRRMWAGGSIRFISPICVGDKVTRHSTIRDITYKKGRTGGLYFVTVDHELTNNGRILITERQDIVYRLELPDSNDFSKNIKPLEPSPEGKYSRSIKPTSTLLFRYSAMTFNGHRIHYDFPYSNEIEGYPGLIVHGPLQATLLCHFAIELKGTIPTEFSFRSSVPIFDNASFNINANPDGNGLTLWTAAEDGSVAMEASAVW